MNTEFDDFAAALGKLVVNGLNQLSPDAKEFVTRAVNDGGEIFAVCRPRPLSVAGMLTYEGKTVEVFRVTPEAEETINYRKLN